ncbi:hypothetical protein VCSRO197_1694 [Vibrio cholerae]|nr:hypothetical protein VCSRO197_1694 [Vibrio cholerae]
MSEQPEAIKLIRLLRVSKMMNRSHANAHMYSSGCIE